METTFIVVICILAGTLGIALGRYVWPVLRGVDPSLLARVQADASRFEEERNELRNRVGGLESDYKSAMTEARTSGELAARLNERTEGLAKLIDELSKQTSALEAQRDSSSQEAKKAAAEVAQHQEREASFLRRVEEQSEKIHALEAQRDGSVQEAKTAEAELARLKERELALAQKIEEQASKLAEQQQQLTVEFENIANRILKANTTELSENSQTALTKILDPLRERIKEFQQKVETTYNAETREVLSLKEQIKLIMETSNAVGNKADGLAKALRGDSQRIGRWGELALERILEAAGLTEGREYITQGRGMNLKNQDGGIQKPDVVILLPENRTMIVDSKVPLASYDRLIAENDEDARSDLADAFVRDVKSHVDDLAEKRYQENEKLDAHDCVLLFVPIEGALAAALAKDPELFTYAWTRRVVLVGPSTLLMTMRTVGSIWRYEQQGENAQEIARLAGDLCDKVSLSLEDMNTVAEKISIALSTHNEAIKRLATGKGNALTLGERIRALGVKTKRSAPSMLVDGVALPAATRESDEDASQT